MNDTTTPQAETQVYAGFWVRVWASIVDSILLSFLIWPLMLLIPGSVSGRLAKLPLENGQAYLANLHLHFPGPLQFFLTWILPAIVIILFWVFRSATPGKMLISAKIVDANSGGHPGTGQLIGRYLGYFVSTIPLCLGLIWVGIDRRKQGWHDKLAHTVVVRNIKQKNAPDFSAGSVHQEPQEERAQGATNPG